MSETPKYFMYFPGNYRWSAAFVNMLGRASYGGADISELHKIGRLLEGHEPVSKARPERLHRSRVLAAGRGQGDPAGHDHARQVARARKGEHGTRHRLQIGRHVAQGRPKVVGRLIPELVKSRTDERPILDPLRRRWNRQVAGTQVSCEVP